MTTERQRLNQLEKRLDDRFDTLSTQVNSVSDRLDGLQVAFQKHTQNHHGPKSLAVSTGLAGGLTTAAIAVFEVVRRIFL